MKRKSANQEVDPLRLGFVVTAMTLIELAAVIYLTTIAVGWVLGQ
ncbi:MAG: hypothetical protein VXW71_01995 [Actinomycetota bacterium]|nr:hypothetical protein [Actinomycetota bacterium]